MKMRTPAHIIFFFCFFWTSLVSAQQTITFTLKAIGVPKSVHVVGDFNHWSQTANPMNDEDGDGIWQTTIQLKPGKYEYRYLIDGSHWIKDPENPIWGGEHSNSILYVKTSQTPEVVNIRPETGSIVRSGHVVITAEYRDGMGKHGLDLTKTKVLLNGQRQKFSFNEKINRIEFLPGKLEDGEYLIEIQAQDRQGNRAPQISSYFIVNAVNSAPVVDAGYTIIAGKNSTVRLNSGIYYDPDKDPIVRYDWKLIRKPRGSKSKLKHRQAPFPYFVPDKVGRYLFTLQISDGKAKSNLDSVDVYAFIKRDYLVEFQLSDSAFASIYETSIDSVSVAGEFNRWDATANPMHDYNRDGIWTCWIKLNPGEYEYKFVVNGKQWIIDPTNPLKVPDGWNGFNSVVSASLNLAPIVRVNASLGPGKIIFDASASYSQIGENLIFLWYQDINNPQRFVLESSPKTNIPTPQKQGTYYFYLVVKDQTGNSAQKTIVLNVDERQVKIRDFSDSPDWAQDAIVYEVFVRTFHPEGNLTGLTEKIPYLKSLGINCIWLMPIFDGPTAHGYGTANFFKIEEDYGTLNDFKIFLAEAHDAGIRVILDFVANHTSDQHPYFLSAFRNSQSAFRHWYRWRDPESNMSYYAYEFHNDWDTLPNLNYENPNVREYILSVARFWANLGVDGFRCDAAWGVPHDFWKIFRRTLKNINPDFLTIDEVLPRSPAYHYDEFDMSYDTDFYGNLLDVMEGKKPLSAIEYGLQKTMKNYPPYTLNFRYIENHDMERFIRRYGAKKTKIAATLLLTIPGTPLIYYGQEIGLEEKTPMMDWSGKNRSLFDYYKKLILLRRHHPCLRRGAMIKVPTNVDEQVYAYLRKTNKESFLVVLNFGSSVEECRLLFPGDNLKKHMGNTLTMKNVLSGEQISLPVFQDMQIKLKLEAESAYIYKLDNSPFTN